MPINHVVLASGAVVAVSVAVATVMAVYESPEFRRYAEDVRRRIAVAFNSMNEGFDPPYREPRFNRPEDADGFFESHRGKGAEPGVDADDETRRKQREELLYWNSIRLEKEKEKNNENENENENEKQGLSRRNSEEKQGLPRPSVTHRGSSFDDFLQPDQTGEHGSFVFNSGADVNNYDGLRRRGEGARGFASAVYANPFADEYNIDNDEIDEDIAHQISPEQHEIMSDIYSATTRDLEERPTPTLEPSTPLVDLAAVALPQHSPMESPATLERELADNEFMSAGQEDRHEAYASIQAWAHESSRDFYSPLPETPVAPISEPELISEDGFSEDFSDGELTPTDSISLAGSGEDVANDTHESEHFENGRLYDVMSESEGMETPASWSEVGSVISESDVPPHR
ncbi:hypothetical protein PT974_01067 [Cladobotryum mycophilum]|uniref:Uncharacterized protein n=1 Tax=Cladobotryum mycophilum TaxID=491253 RepID=A0ABR0T3T4_9HYPO